MYKLLFASLFHIQLNPCLVLSLQKFIQPVSDQVPVVNAFSGCSINVLNIGGINIDFSTIFQPVVLFHYISFPEVYNLFPFEMSPYKSNKLSTWVLRINLTEIMNTGKLSVNNKTIWFLAVKAVKYFKIIFKTRLRFSLKNTNCEANFYLHPPNKKHAPHFFHRELLKTSLQTYHYGYYLLDWQMDYINTISKYSILICNKASGSICEDNQHKRHWINSATTHMFFKRLVEVVLIWENDNFLEIHCPYCNPCDPLETIIQQTTLISFKNSVTQGTKNVDETYPNQVNIVLFVRLVNHEFTLKPVETKLDHLLNYISTVSAFEFESFELAEWSDIHQIAQLFSDNITLYFTDEYDTKFDQMKKIKVNGCQEVVSHPAKFRPIIHRKTNFRIASYQEIGLVFHRKQMRFVSCHKEQAQWIRQFKELFIAFDKLTWTLILVSFVLIACVQSHAYAQFRVYWLRAVADTCFSFVTSLMEQSNRLFQKPKSKCLVCTFPLLFIVLSNAYKGDNITRITLEPSLIRFDTFDSLVQNNFTIYSRWTLIPNDMQQYLKQNLGLMHNYVEYSAHEFFPIISELWFQIISRFSFALMKTLENMMHELPKRTQFYLNNSKLSPYWKHNKTSYSFNETLHQVLDMHLEPCDKSVIIVNENFAILLHTI